MWILSGYGLVFSNCFLEMNWLIFNVNEFFIPFSKSYLVTVTFLNFGVDWGKISLYVVEARSWSYHTFSRYLSVWSRILLKKHKTKHRSRLIPKDDMRWECHFQPLFPECQILCVENKHESITEWPTGWNCFSFFNRRKIKHCWLYISSS